MRVVLTGGGTGGHLYPGLAIVDELRRRFSCKILFIGTKKGLEARVVPEMGYTFKRVWISGLSRRSLIRNLLFPMKMVVSLTQSLLIIKRFDPEFVIGTGGYVSWPVVAAGVVLRKRTIMQEQNILPGLVTRVMAPLVDVVFLSYDESIRYFRKRSNLEVVGNPTRADLTTTRPMSDFGLDPGGTVLFVFGGSQGAAAINRAVLHMVDHLMQIPDLQILWSAGPRWADDVSRSVRKYGGRISVFPFIDDMASAYKISDLILSRAGATTIAEITRLGLASVFVPLPGAAGGHQEENAKALWKAGACEFVLEDRIYSGELEKVLQDLLKNSEKRKKMGRNAKRFARPDASKRIVDHILRLKSEEE